MKINPHRRFSDLIEKIIEHLKGFVLALIAVVALLGIIVGYKYYRHTQEEPEFCMSCHMMKEAFLEWQKGKHRDITCQKCHHLNLIEQNQLLFAFAFKGPAPFSQKHGRMKPWNECRKCHLSEAAQGSVTLRKSYGHARHVFMQNIDCKACHGNSLHQFVPDAKACLQCHEDKGVHGVGMEAFSCLKCHTFAEKSPAMIPRDRCIACHKNQPETGPMLFLCHQCHKPHKKIKLKSEDCLGQCHRNEVEVGQHKLHMDKKMECLDCHKAHAWAVGQKQAKGLCNRCHPVKDPMKFIH